MTDDSAGVGPELVTDRLVMRRWRDADREPFAAMNADPGVMRYLLAPLDRVDSDAMVDRIEGLFEQHGWGLWALEMRASRTFIGFTGLAPMPAGVPGEGGVEVGWRLARHAWGQGLATEAAGAVSDFAFEVVGMEEIWSLAAAVNRPSVAVMERIGMTLAATCDHPRVPERHPLRPHVIYHLKAPAD